MRLMSGSDRRKVVAVAILQISMGSLDLLGVLAIGLIGALSVTGLQAQESGERVNSVLRVLNVENLSYESQVITIGGCVIILFVGRTVLSIFFTRRILFFFSRRGAELSTELISRVLSQPLLKVQERTTQSTLYAATTGVSVITLGILATAVVLISDASLLLVLAVGLLIVDPFTALGIFLVFTLVGFVLYRSMHVKALILGERTSALNIHSNEKIVEVFGSYRELVVRNRRNYYAREIGKVRIALADASAEVSFMPYVSKYVIETSVVIGALLIGTTQFILQDAPHAVATLAIFLAAGTRIAPAVLRLQQGLIQMRGSLGAALPTLNLIDSLGDSLINENVNNKVDREHLGFVPEILVSDVKLTYPGNRESSLFDINLSIPPGTFVALVGPSGAGKTTLIDILLGVLIPDCGSVRISGLPPLQAVAKWPGAFSYVPQDVFIAAGTIRENVAMGYPLDEASDELVISALKTAHLDRFVEELPNGIDTQIGEQGARISGGQRQRLGIARAMFTRPSLLVLDEATSSLDGETEAEISEALGELRGTTTVVMIAHRLSTVRDADIVVYLSDGRIIATGTFQEVRDTVPDFDHQAKLMGL